MRQFLQYWKTYNSQYEFDTPLNFAASAQFVRLRPGDVLWIVAILEGRLTLLGRLLVARITDRENAIKEVGDNVYDAPLCAIAKRGTIHNIVEIDIQQRAPHLRFNSPNDRLRLPDPDFTNGQQLQTIREITVDTASMLQGVLESNGVGLVGH